MRYSIKSIDLLFVSLLVICIPFMFYLQVGIKINASIADIVILFTLFWILLLKKNRLIIKTMFNSYQFIFLYMFVLLLFYLLSMLNYWEYEHLDLPYGISAFIKLGVNFIYVFTLLFFAEKYKEEMVQVFLRAWKFISVIVAMLAILGASLYRFGISSRFSLDHRAQGTFDDPNMLAMYLAISISFISLYQVLIRKKRVLNLSTLILIVAIIFTASRGGIIALGFAIIFILGCHLIRSNGKELLKFISVIGLIICALFYVATQTELLNDSLNRVTEISTEDRGTRERVMLWSTAFNMWQENVWIGVGIGQFQSYSNNVLGSDIGNIPHNTYLSILAETGTFGFIAFIWFPFYLFLQLLKGLSKSEWKIHLYLMIGYITMLIQAFTINVENFRFIWIFLAILYFLLKNKFFINTRLQLGKEKRRA
jgi:O-antigen ligase